LRTFEAFMHGDPPSTAELEEVTRLLGSPPPARSPEDALRDALDALSAGAVPMVVVIGVGTDAVVEVRVTADPSGATRMSETRVWPWAVAWRTSMERTSMESPSPPEERELRFQLAGGGTLPAGLRERVLAGLKLWIYRRAQQDARVILLSRADGWLIPDEAMAQLSLLYRRAVVTRTPASGPVATAGGVERFVRSTIDRIPLRSSFGLVVAEVNEAGMVQPVFHELFAPHTEVTTGSLLTAEVAVTTRTRRAACLTLAVVARRGAGPSLWEPVAERSAWFAPGQVTDVRVEVRSPKDIRITHPDAALTGGLDYAEALRALPTQVEPDALDPVDLAFAVELAGSLPTVQQRLELVVDVLETIAESYPDPGSVRARVIGYIDHPKPAGYTAQERAETTRVIDGVRFGPLADAAAKVRAWADHKWSPPAESYQAAPLEDALAELAGSPWRPGARPALVVVGSRPPHPPSARFDSGYGAGPVPCPREHDWRADLRTLADRPNMTRVAVWDPPGWAHPGRDDPYGPAARAFWENHLPTGTPLSLRQTDARRVAAAAGLLPPSRAKTLPFPVLAGDRGGGPGRH
jgi:hypothetical protein